MENEDSDVLDERKNIYAADLEKLKESKWFDKLMILFYFKL